MKTVFLLTGSNIEPRISFLEKAENEIGHKVGDIIKRSKVYESEPWGFKDETSFLNRVLIVKTKLNPATVLKSVLEIEKEMGRSRVGKKYASRRIDIDILYYEEKVIQKEFLQIPHPRLRQRRFTLVPLVEIAPDFVHPVFKLNHQELLVNCDDRLIVNEYKTTNS